MSASINQHPAKGELTFKVVVEMPGKGKNSLALAKKIFLKWKMAKDLLEKK